MEIPLQVSETVSYKMYSVCLLCVPYLITTAKRICTTLVTTEGFALVYQENSHIRNSEVGHFQDKSSLVFKRLYYFQSNSILYCITSLWNYFFKKRKKPAAQEACFSLGCFSQSIIH